MNRTIGTLVTILSFVLGWHLLLWSQMDKSAHIKINPVNDVATIDLPSASSSGFTDQNAKMAFDGAREMVGVPIAERKLNNAVRQYFDVYAMAIPYRVVIVDQKLDTKNPIAKTDSSKPVKVYSMYRNDRFGFSSIYPAGFVSGRMPQNGDGLSFHSPDDKAMISVSGSNNDGESLEEHYQEALNRSGEKATYTHLGNGWFVISELSDTRIFYTKVFVGANSNNTLIVSYPSSESAVYDPIVKRVETSFRPGDLSQSW